MPDKDALDSPKPGCFSRRVASHPRSAMAITFLVGAQASERACAMHPIPRVQQTHAPDALDSQVIVLAAGMSMIKPFKEPVNTGWSNTASTVIQQVDAFSGILCADSAALRLVRDPVTDEEKFEGPLAPASGRRLQSPAAIGSAFTRSKASTPTIHASLTGRQSRRRLNATGSDECYLSSTEDQITVMYECAPDGNCFSDSQVADIADMERGVLETPGWANECRRVCADGEMDGTGVVGASKCASPVTILNYLYDSAATHESECRRGWCITDMVGLSWGSVCGAAPGQVPWGTHPCRSRVFDWRDGTRAPRSEWTSLVNQTAMPAAVRSYYLSELRATLGEMRDLGATEFRMQSNYVRARCARAARGLRAGCARAARGLRAGCAHPGAMHSSACCPHRIEPCFSLHPHPRPRISTRYCSGTISAPARTTTAPLRRPSIHPSVPPRIVSPG